MAAPSRLSKIVEATATTAPARTAPHEMRLRLLQYQGAAFLESTSVFVTGVSITVQNELITGDRPSFMSLAIR